MPVKSKNQKKSKKSAYLKLIKPNLVGILLIAIILVKFLLYWSSLGHILEASDLSTTNIINGINAERALRNVPLLKTDSSLSLAAQEKSDDMQKRHYFSHTDPEGNYVWNKIVAAGYTPYSTLGENLAIEFYNTESLVAAWMNSPTHRQNLLNENFKDQGMGLTFGSPQKSEYYSAITNTFGSLLSYNTPALLQVPITKNPVPKSTSKIPAKVVTESPAKKPLEPKATSSFPLDARAGQNLPVAVNDAKKQDSPALESNFVNQPLTKGEESNSEQQVIGQKENLFQQNRKFTIALAALLVLLLLADLKLFQKQKFPNLDKKLNNLVLLGLAILITAFLYWV